MDSDCEEMIYPSAEEIWNNQNRYALSHPEDAASSEVEETVDNEAEQAEPSDGEVEEAEQEVEAEQEDEDEALNPPEISEDEEENDADKSNLNKSNQDSDHEDKPAKSDNESDEEFAVSCKLFLSNFFTFQIFLIILIK